MRGRLLNINLDSKIYCRSILERQNAWKYTGNPEENTHSWLFNIDSNIYCRGALEKQNVWKYGRNPYEKKRGRLLDRDSSIYCRGTLESPADKDLQTLLLVRFTRGVCENNIRSP